MLSLWSTNSSNRKRITWSPKAKALLTILVKKMKTKIKRNKKLREKTKKMKIPILKTVEKHQLKIRIMLLMILSRLRLLSSINLTQTMMTKKMFQSEPMKMQKVMMKDLQELLELE